MERQECTAARKYLRQWSGSTLQVIKEGTQLNILSRFLREGLRVSQPGSPVIVGVGSHQLGHVRGTQRRYVCDQCTNCDIAFL